MKTLTKDKYLSDSEVSDLKRVLRLVEARHLRDVLLIELALYSGARQGELLTIKASDLDPDTCSVFIREPEKNSDKRSIPLPEEFFNRLESYAQTVDGCLFDINESRVRQIWLDIRPFKKKFHALRHTFARYWYAKKKDLRLVQYLLGHKSINSTMIYTSIDYEASALRKEMYG